MGEKLSSYVPQHKRSERHGVPIEFREELSPVVERISKIIPPELMWEIFSSTPAETGGKIAFPYSRVDSSVIVARDWAYILNKHGHKYSEAKWREYYMRGCAQAFEALLWVEVGFEGLENLANSKASLNWTTAAGHSVNDEERAINIMTSGKKMYEECLREFVEFRNDHSIVDDYFSQYGVEYLLEPFSKN